MIVLGVYLFGLVLTILLLARGFCALFSTRSRAAINRHPLVHGALFLLAGAIWLAPWGKWPGRLEAAADFGRGKFLIYSVPRLENAVTRITLSEILREKYGIHYAGWTGCSVTSRNERLYRVGYDSVMLPKLRDRFGPEFLDAAIAEAKLEAERREKDPSRLRARPPRGNLGNPS